MKDKERDYLDDLFREKLYDFESEVVDADWQAIVSRLPQTKSATFRRAWRYWAAAAAVLLAAVVGGLYVSAPRQAEQPLAETVKPTPVPVRPVDPPPAVQPEAVAPVQEAAPLMAEARVAASKPSPVQPGVAETEPEIVPQEAETSANPLPQTNANETDALPAEIRSYKTTPRLRKPETAAAPQAGTEKTSRRRWSFGMGAGSVSASTDNSLVAVVNSLRSTAELEKELAQLNSPYFNEQNVKAAIEHKMPISLGFGVSYSLTDRFALQSGLTYTYLLSEWERGAVYFGTTKQKLHFIGIPLSLTYKIAEWKRVVFYASAGAMAEVNVAGKLSSRIIVDEEEVYQVEEERIRMKEWLWSVNGRVGASYPLWRFLSVYAEAGVGYYFDNGSTVETIRSEKPFNLSLQAGFRLGF